MSRLLVVWKADALMALPMTGFWMAGEERMAEVLAVRAAMAVWRRMTGRMMEAMMAKMVSWARGIGLGRKGRGSWLSSGVEVRFFWEAGCE